MAYPHKSLRTKGELAKNGKGNQIGG
jgi:hypothetical protein